MNYEKMLGQARRDLLVGLLLIALITGSVVTAQVLFYKQLVTSGTLEFVGGIEIVDMNLRQVDAENVTVAISYNVVENGTYRFTVIAGGVEVFEDVGATAIGGPFTVTLEGLPVVNLYTVEVTKLP